jgi:hypothetical protein
MTEIFKGGGNTQWFHKRFHFSLNIIPENYSYRIVDISDDGLAKRVLVFLINVSAGFDEGDTAYWQDFVLEAGGMAYFNFFGDNVIRASINSFSLPDTVAVNHTIYGSNGTSTDFVIEDGSVNPSEFKIHNNDTTYDMNVSIMRNGRIIETSVIGPDAIKTVQYRPTFWIAATSDLEATITLDDVNTEISILGVNTADINVDASDDVYTFTLANITFA